MSAAQRRLELTRLTKAQLVDLVTDMERCEGVVAEVYRFETYRQYADKQAARRVSIDLGDSDG